MAKLTPQEQEELQKYIQEHFTHEDMLKITALIAIWLNIDIQGLNVQEGCLKVAQAIQDMSTTEFNGKLVDALMKAKKEKNSTGEEKKEVADIRIDSRPHKVISPNTKAANRLFAIDNNKYYQGMRQLRVEGERSKKKISVSLFVKYDEQIDTGFHLSSPHENRMLECFDRVIHDAIVTQFLNGNTDITTNMIYQVISGNSEGLSANNHVSKSLSVAISESIERLYRSWVEIDATEQAKAYGFEEGLYKGHLLTGYITEGRLNGNITTCAHISEIPILYKHAHDCGQVIRYDVKALNIPALENSPECIVLKTYLLQQIEIMRHKKEYNRTICFDTLYELLSVDAPSDAALRMKKKQVRDHIIKCLDYWTAKKHIQGYEINRIGKAIVSVTLKVKVIPKPAKFNKGRVELAEFT